MMCEREDICNERWKHFDAYIECFRCGGAILEGYTHDGDRIFCRRCWKITRYILEDSRQSWTFFKMWVIKS